MNERIKELAEQAYEQQPLMIANPETFEIEHKIGNGGIPMYTREFNKQKFAELIVRECVLISRTSTDGFSAGQRMEEHFGVEE